MKPVVVFEVFRSCVIDGVFHVCDGLVSVSIL